jgi:hypothetical protein
MLLPLGVEPIMPASRTAEWLVVECYSSVHTAGAVVCKSGLGPSCFVLGAGPSSKCFGWLDVRGPALSLDLVAP